MDQINLRVYVLEQPTVPLQQMLDAARAVYGGYEIEVRVKSVTALDLGDLTDLDAGTCGGMVTEDQAALFAHRPGAGDRDICIYLVRTTVPAYNGCATHPAATPGAVVAALAPEWSLAHEVGHVLGLEHVNDRTCLMTGGGTNRIVDPPPELSAEEVATVRASRLVDTRPGSPR